MPLGGYIVRRR